jgi:hypothetical protein
LLVSLPRPSPEFSIEPADFSQTTAGFVRRDLAPDLAVTRRWLRSRDLQALRAVVLGVFDDLAPGLAVTGLGFVRAVLRALRAVVLGSFVGSVAIRTAGLAAILATLGSFARFLMRLYPE